MSKVIEEKSYIFHSQLGNILVKKEKVRGYDVEDIVSDQAFSQAMSIRLLNLGKKVNINQTTGPRTIASNYFGSEEELPDG